MGVTLKQELRDITRQVIGTATSSIFLDRCLAIIHESADDTESLLTAAERVSKRLSLFIDQSLAQKVFAALKAKIDPVKSSTRFVRKYKRVSVSKVVYVTCNGRPHELFLQNISLGGMYLKMDNPLPKDSAIGISLPLENDITLRLTGVVVYTKEGHGDNSEHSPGMGIRFNVMHDDEFRLLGDYLDGLSKRCDENKA